MFAIDEKRSDVVWIISDIIFPTSYVVFLMSYVVLGVFWKWKRLWYFDNCRGVLHTPCTPTLSTALANTANFHHPIA